MTNQINRSVRKLKALFAQMKMIDSDLLAVHLRAEPPYAVAGCLWEALLNVTHSLRSQPTI